ncbi:hypothetical protein ASG76_15280 [Nocardioides sp. Soil774]|uniref:FlgD immunoglobulin-like domain containing protein n=1 Tax=Nocardioides sp. Soil774 TaxID=1736408 RepID=UPI0006F42966|nr:FlgD immunoglobulin-like domain containing protein [Nocardioides sp. Soil774]KRE92827.1 hypothetical protein ASG76_15280 [Nocardioides sp. Soil774]
MVRRLARAILGLALLATPALAVVAPADAAGNGWRISATSRFSPNGDGVKDTLSIRYRVPDKTHVYLAVSRADDRLHHLRTVDLGKQAAGTHEWTWDGRNQSGKRLMDQRYVVSVYDHAPTGQAARAYKKVQVDTTFWAELGAPTYGAELGAPARVFPRTTVVTDTLDLAAYSEEKKLTSLELVIRNGKGRVVLRADVAEPRRSTNGFLYGHGRTVEWAAVRGGKPLPSGRYTAVVVGQDKAGNTGRTDAVRIWVSADKLEWQEKTVTVAPDASVVGPCDYDGGMGCGDYTYCGRVVASGLFPGGLSYRSAECATPPINLQTQAVAVASHMLEVPEATGVRGLAAVRVAFTGAPTTAGEPDTATLVVYGTHSPAPNPTTSIVKGTSGQSAWVEEPGWGEGLAEDVTDGFPQRDPAALWSFSTHGTDSVDVSSFTVDVRYLAVQP